MYMAHSVWNALVLCLLAGGMVGGQGVMLGIALPAWASDSSQVTPVQMPFEAPPKPQPAPDTSVPPLTEPLGPEELKRAEALLPMLEGKQEFWAIGEFVHLGP